MSSVTKPVSTVIFTNLLMAAPAFAEGGKLFDFGLTLPIMAGQFLLLMVFLDKTWFTPVGKVLDERDELIRSKLAAVQDDSSKLAEMQAEAERILKEARDAATAAVNEARATTQAEQDAKLEALRAVRFVSVASDSVFLASSVILVLSRGARFLAVESHTRASVVKNMVYVQQLDQELANSVKELEVERERASASIGEQVRYAMVLFHLLELFAATLAVASCFTARQTVHQRGAA
jgi:F0F1-type ATP synthase membrane subunit b/b'